MSAPMAALRGLRIWNQLVNIKARRILLSRSIASGVTTQDGSVSTGGRADLEMSFLDPEVQSILKKITQLDVEKVFPTKKQTIKPPKYKLLTDEQVEELQEEYVRKSWKKLELPPVMKMADQTTEVLAEDEELVGFDKDNSKFVFTDITYGMPNRDRFVVVREPDGVLRTANFQERAKVMQVYFPEEERQLHTPKMFSEENLEGLLKRGKYEYVLERACVQFEPDDPEYLRVTHRVYEHIDSTRNYDHLSSTRHFGCMAFYLAYYSKIDHLLTHFLQQDRLEHAAGLVKVFHVCSPRSPSSGEARNQKGLSPLSLVKLYVEHDAREKGTLELALQTLEES